MSSDVASSWAPCSTSLMPAAATTSPRAATRSATTSSSCRGSGRSRPRSVEPGRPPPRRRLPRRRPCRPRPARPRRWPRPRDAPGAPAVCGLDLAVDLRRRLGGCLGARPRRSLGGGLGGAVVRLGGGLGRRSPCGGVVAAARAAVPLGAAAVVTWPGACRWPPSSLASTIILLGLAGPSSRRRRRNPKASTRRSAAARAATARLDRLDGGRRLRGTRLLPFARSARWRA